MRSFFLLVFCLFSLGVVFSQAPDKFTYQSIIRGESGLILKSTELGIKLSVLKNSRTGTVVYSEVHSTSSNKNGLVTFLIGEGTSSDIFSDIDWSTGEYFLKVEVDPMGGIDYSIEQTSQLLSVPYALYASRTSNVDLDKDVEGILPVSRGGTGSPVAPMIAVVTAPDASTARAILGIDNSGGSGSGGTKLILSTVADNYLSIKDSATNEDEQELTAGNVPLTLGGTGATDAAGARTNLGLGTIATQASDDVDVDGGAIDGTIIGANTPSTGVFTSVNSGLVQSVGDTDIIIKTGNDTTGTITLANGADGNINISPNGTGQVVIDALKFPAADGTTGQVLKTDGSGNLTWSSVDAAGTDNSTAVTLATVTDNYLTITGQEITAGNVPLTLGGTGATDAAGARTNLGLGTIATQSSDDVDVDGGAIDGTIIGANTPSTGVFTSVNSGLVQSVGDTDIIIKTGNDTTGTITLANGADGNINISPNGTGQVVIDALKFPAADGTTGQVLKTDGSGNLTWSSVDAAGTDNSTAVTLATVTDNYLTITGQEITAGNVPLTLGGTGATDAAGARTNLGLGTIATQASDDVDVDGGAIDGTIIGANTPSTGVFTSVNSGLVQSVGDTDIIIKTGNDTTGTITLANGADGNINISPNGTGKVVSDNTDLTGTTRLAGTTIIASGAELNALDGDNTAQSITVESADRIVINDDGTMKQIAVSTVGAFLISSLNLQLNSLNDVVDSGEVSNFGNSLLIGTGSYSGTGSTDNTGVGTQALDALTTGDDNTALGYNALTANTEGSDNIGIGQNALKANTTGNDNIALGSDALSANISGNNNLSIGLNSLKTGNYVDGSNDFSNNVTLGNYALELTTTGSDNTSIGYRTGDNNTTGKSNIFIGSNAGDTNTIGEENIIIGTDADTGAINAINRIVIGDDTSGSFNNTAVIGNDSVTDVYMSEDSGATVHADGVKFYEDTANGTNYVGFNSAASLAGNQVWTLPTADGSANQVLKTDGNGILSWNSDSDSGSLVQITENSKTGYRLSGVDPANYADIGTDAVDLSYSETPSMGAYNGAKGNYSFASGFETMALGYKSFAAGNKVTASGNLSTAFGDQTTAGAVNATTFGTGTTAKDFSSFIIGSYNSVGSTTTVNGSLSSYDADNSAFVIGNGADSSNKSDAFVVYSNGNTAIAGTLTLGGAFTVPASIGSSGQVLKVPASGSVLEWGSSGGGVTSISGLSDGFTPTANSVYLGTGEDYDMTSSNSQYNVAVGTYAMRNANADSDDVAVGYDALNGPNPGSSNTAIGSNALKAMNGGGSNVGLGYGAGNVITTGDNNVIIGSGADPSANNASNEIVIGQGTTGVAPGAVTLGNASVTDVYMAQDMGAMVHADGVKFYEDTGGNYVGFNSAASLTGNQVWTLPTVDGNDGQVLKTGGNGVLDWVNNSGVAGGIDDLSDAISVAGSSESIYIGGSTQTSTRIGNTSLGWHAMSSYTSTNAPTTIDGGNTAIGYRALRDLKTGRFNSALGYHSLVALQTGDSNVAIGTHNATSMTSGSDNIFIGRNVGGELTTGSSGNVLIGKDANVNSSNANASNQIVIGYQATGIEDNTVVLGNSSVDKLYAAQDGDAVVHTSGLDRGSGSGTNIAGEVLTIKSGAGTGSGDGGSIIFQVADAGASGSSVNPYATAFTIQDTGNAVLAGTLTENSDISLKENVKTLPSQLEKIKKLNAVSYNKKATGIKEIGFVAQELEKLFPGLVFTDKTTGLKSVNYGRLTSVITKAIQEQQQQIDSLKKQNKELLERLEKLESLLMAK